MPELGFPVQQIHVPAAADAGQAGIGIERWRSAAASPDGDATAVRVDALVADGDARALIEGVFGNSPYLTACAERDPRFFCDLLTFGPDATVAIVLDDVAETRRRACDGSADPTRALRIAKRRIALTVAIADIAGLWPLDRVTGVLSTLADQALSTAAAYLLAEAAAAGTLTQADSADPERGSGLVILGLGKLGARELNYSSDIDLIVLYDSERIVTPDRDALQQRMVRLTRRLVGLMETRTADGYVFRTDLRLRPDPGSTPLALSVLAAEAYYESLGQNWERAAMIKARPVAGDIEAGEAFLGRLVPFVWRKHLDFAAIRDIHSIKRQINAHRGGAKIAVADHNIKLGRGGIREIEFFAQTQQLIWGGRMPEIRQRGTVASLSALADAGRISSTAKETLAEAYAYLRRVEHRLQMIDDAQTHTLPGDGEELSALAVFLGHRDAGAFETEIRQVLRAVEALYADLFEDAPTLAGAGDWTGNLVFTGGEADPETLETLRRLGYAQPTVVDGTVRGWHHGRYRAMRSTRARELLTEMMPMVLRTLADTPDPDAAFLAFDRFLAGLPAGVQVFSMIQVNPHLLQLIAEIAGAAPGLAKYLARRPGVLESVLTADFFRTPPTAAALADELDHLLAGIGEEEEVLDTCRRWADDRRFQVGVQTLRDHLDTAAGGGALSNIADAAIGALLPRVQARFAEVHGTVADAGMAVVAMGKLGGREMTATSDLDLIFVYGPGPIRADAMSDGPRPLAASQYFARLSQRLINALTAPTAEGVLYEVDMRLRPSGKAGPIACSLETFARYQRDEAWTWEQMALTRARVVCGPSDLAAAVTRVIGEALVRPRDPNALVADVASMRIRMDAEHHTESPWEIKHFRGGLVDIEFIVQFLQLRHGADRPAVLSPNTRQALVALREAGLLEGETAADLIDALDLWQTLQARLRLTGSHPNADDPGDGLPRPVRAAAGEVLEDTALRTRIIATAGRVRDHYSRLIDQPAAAASPDDPSQVSP